MTTALRDRLRSQRGLPRFDGIRGFLGWWRDALLSWLPRSWRQALGMERGRLLLQPQGAQQGANQGVQLRLQEGDALRDLALLPPGDDETSSTAALLSLLAPSAHDLPRWLLLPASVALRRTLSLPAAAAERLRDVVGFEIDRQTPFSIDSVAFDARVRGRGGSDAQIEVELVAVPRAALAGAEAAIGDLSAGLAGIDVLGADGAPLRVTLLDPAQRRTQADPMRQWNLVLAAVALVAVSAALWQLLQNRRAAAEAFETETRAVAERARTVSNQRQQLVDIVEGQAFLDRTRAGRPTTVEVLDDLSRRLADNTYLDKLAIEGDRITLIGRSTEASALLGRMEGSKLWRAPALTGALQPDARTGRDIFTVTADLAVAAPPQNTLPEGRRRGAAD